MRFGGCVKEGVQRRVCTSKGVGRVELRVGLEVMMDRKWGLCGLNE